MSARATRPFVVAEHPRAGDAFDVVSTVAPILARYYREVRWVTPLSDISLRGLRRSLRPDRDRILYDFTQPSTAIWAAEIAQSTPGLVLCGPRRLPLRMNAHDALRRARRRYGGVLTDHFPPMLLASLDADIPGVAHGLQRPLLRIAADEPTFSCAVICPPDGTAEVYGVLRGWRNHLVQARPDTRLLISVTTPEDAAAVSAHMDILGLAPATARIDIELSTHRADLAEIARRSALIVDLDRFSWTGVTDPLIAAAAAGRPALRMTASLHEMGDAFLALLRQPPQAEMPSRITGAAFTRALVHAIEAAHRSTVDDDQPAEGAA